MYIGGITTRAQPRKETEMQLKSRKQRRLEAKQNGEKFEPILHYRGNGVAQKPVIVTKLDEENGGKYYEREYIDILINSRHFVKE